MASKFIVIRKDLAVDPSVVESDGFTIGRLVSNDLTLNHPGVSRTHAGIKEVGADFWVFNLSNANGTILNGATVDSAPLAAGDTIQIGPFTIYVSFPDNTLTLTVEMSVNPMRAEGAGTTMLAPTDLSGKTQMLSPAMLQAQQQKATPGGTQRLSMTGKLTGLLNKPEEFALKVFWDKRKRDAGKMAEATVLKPNLLRGRVGKARFNWRTSSDLRRPWPVSLFLWGAMIITFVSVVSVFAYKNAYSPGPLSSPHVRDALAAADPGVAVAKEPNANHCTTCHSAIGSMQAKCMDCHTTAAFKSTTSTEHEAVGVACTECHTMPGHPVEHMGDAMNLTVAAKDSCTVCHRVNYTYRNAKTGQLIKLDTPHGGSQVGYPVQNGNWTWAGWSEDKWQRFKLPKTAADFDAKGQFHILHVSIGKPEEQVQCSDCHTAGFDPANIKKGVMESCAVCHNPNPEQLTSTSAPVAAGVQCTSCHMQHTTGKDPLALVRARQVNAQKP